MKFDPIVIIAGEPNSIFIEILIKILKKISIKTLLGSPATIIIGLNFINFKIFLYFVKVHY